MFRVMDPVTAVHDNRINKYNTPRTVFTLTKARKKEMMSEQRGEEEQEKVLELITEKA